eukprot:TRINITY_DN635_c0_g1_i3.p1 TRINITY_DN635_c0_g1~~TRINITY_DN635_c0_g1_i3.p1  ORF type:complete len:280 (-),score=55.26 TRINITY_DN635_c0_g1_i3:41-880(-)
MQCSGVISVIVCFFFFFFQAEDGIRDVERSRGLGDVYKRQVHGERKQMVDDFCARTFVALDKDERNAPTITKGHAIQFNSMSHFIELLSVYGSLSPEWEEKRKYCKYKAGNILKCLKQGIDPPRGHPNDPPPEKKKELPPADPSSEGYPPIPPEFSYPSMPQPNVLPPPAEPSNFAPNPPMPPPAFSYPNIQPSVSPVEPLPAHSIVPPSKKTAGRKFDPRNCHNSEGKIMRAYPKYYEVLGLAQKSTDHAVQELKGRVPLRALECLEQALEYLDSLEG